MNPGGSDAVSWWQVAGALVAVFALLLLTLKVLHRWQPGAGRDAEVRLLSVQRLGPRRELHRLRVKDRVHVLYRQEGAMVLLDSEPWAEPVTDRPAPRPPRRALLAPRLKAWVAAAGGKTAVGFTRDNPRN